MSKRGLAGVVLLCSIAASARAGEFELFSGAWKYSLGGQITDGSTSISLDHDQGIQVSGQALAAMRYRLKSPWDFGLAYQHLGAAGSYIAPTNEQFGGIVIVQGQTTVQAGVNINSFDGSVHYRLLDRQALQLGIGAELKFLTGHYTVAGITNVTGLVQIPVIQPQRNSIDMPVPMPHATADYEPWSWLRLRAAGGYAALAGNHLGEWGVAADLQFRPVALTVGYLDQLYRVKSGGTIIDARVGGPMFGISMRTW